MNTIVIGTIVFIINDNIYIKINFSDYSKNFEVLHDKLALDYFIELFFTKMYYQIKPFYGMCDKNNMTITSSEQPTNSNLFFKTMWVITYL